MYKQYGDFIYGKKEFMITERDIPRNWYNYLWNDNYITFVSQCGVGCGFMQDKMSRRLNSLNDRAMFIKDEDATWGITGLPVDETLNMYSCTHGLGYTNIETINNDIKSQVTFFVPNDFTCEVWHIKIKNIGQNDRKMKLFVYNGHDLDGTYTRQGYNTDASYFDTDLNGVLFSGYTGVGSDVVRRFFGYTVMNEIVDGYNATVNSFIGPYGSLAYPQALKKGGCTNSDGVGEKLAAALEKNIFVGSGQSIDIIVVCGVTFDKQTIHEVRRKFANGTLCDKELSRIKEKFEVQISQVNICTPDEKLNEMFSWLKHQSNMGSHWARVRSNGYRDMLSDTDCLACVNPELALSRFERILEYQYSNGYAPRKILGGIRDENFSDNTVWITFTAMSILKETGDISILDRVVKFNDNTEATIYEHIKRSIDFLYKFRGLHNLIKIWGGDWNDCMNTAGLGGKGVSVWLSLAWLRANKMFGEIAEIYGMENDATESKKRSGEMSELIEKYGWDGEYYLDAYNDDDEKIGSHENKEGMMFLIPQLWAVLSGVSSSGREITAMNSVEKYLSDPLGTKICTPAYSEFNSGIGYITRKYPGIHENGGVYLHTIAWKIAADAMMKRTDRIEADIECILPFRNKVVDGRAEPYIMCNSYFGVQTGYRYGTPGQSWRTAAGQWFQKALVNYVYGLKPEIEGLRLEPCLPLSWKNASITKDFRGTIYDIYYINGGTKIKKILVDGKEITGTILPLGADHYSVTVETID